ncbi:MAG: hypothetical protein F6J94_02010 [Moorea sp. SIO1F2]|uniref:hypothetical protein n=1 Tax=Moorena sp. SIO1F2 TaxID=2607819 RepID=UPI0013BA00C2|nr:hypothetical protein [Moorena sp. SIO1F2]NET80792.1 hypothetical protein [Moorena sp. SIO1F2]
MAIGQSHLAQVRRILPISRFSRLPTPDSRFPFPSWEGLGVGSDSRLPSYLSSPSPVR